MKRGTASERRPRRRLAGAFALAAVLAGVLAASASAGVSTITDGYTPYGGHFGPGHSLSRVYVHDYNGGEWACEDAQSLGGSWVYNAVCVTNNAVYTDLCGCVGRYGWNGPLYNYGYQEYMTGHEDW